VLDVASDAWSRPGARVAACSVFALAAENPVLRPSSSTVVERWAAALGPGVTSVPRHAVDDVIAALPDTDVARLAGLAEQLAVERWRALVDEVGVVRAREPLLVGVATAAISEFTPPPRWLVAMRESTADEAPGAVNVLASLLHPESVWTAGEIRSAHAVASALPLSKGLAAIVAFAETEMTMWHLERVRFVARSVAPAIPIPEAPSTSRQLADALKLIRRTGRARELCRLLLLSAALRLDGLVPVVPSQN
jgi:hypothetical protein